MKRNHLMQTWWHVGGRGALLLGLALGLAGCLFVKRHSDRNATETHESAATSEPKNVCEAAYNRRKHCIDAAECAAGADETATKICKMTKALYGRLDSYERANAFCRRQTRDDAGCECAGKTEQREQAFMDCALDPVTCTCAKPE